MIELREQFLSIATAKHVFTHPKRGIVFVVDPIPLTEATRFQLAPVLVYALTCAGTAISRIAFSPLDRPMSIATFLNESWQADLPLRGKPETLRISRALEAADAGFVAALRGVGVEVVTAGTSDKTLPAALRSAQTAAKELGWISLANDEAVADIQRLNSSAQDRYARAPEDIIWLVRNKDRKERTVAWLGLPMRPLERPLPTAMDWMPGVWLSSWEANIPSGLARQWHTDKHNQTHWLVTDAGGSADRDGLDSQDDLDDDSEWSDSPMCSEAVANIIKSWPGGKSATAGAAGITLQKLNWFMSGKKPLPRQTEYRLMETLGIEFNEQSGEHEPEGPCVLIADSDKATVGAYDALSHGGDLAYSIEVVPDRGLPDPIRQYLIFQAWGGCVNILMVARGSKISGHLDSKLINFTGLQKLPETFYRDIVSTCALACRNPEQNVQHMHDFAERNRDRLDALEDISSSY